MTLTHLDAFLDKMAADHLPPIVMDTFSDYYGQVVNGATGLIHDAEISPLGPSDVAAYDDLGCCSGDGCEAMPATVRIILNGGLGTSMGLTGPKSLIPVRDGHSFLSLLLHEAGARDAALALMNSFNTHDDTVAALSRLPVARPPLLFLQHKFPKILRNGFAPADWPANRELEWNPPGHGDIFTALETSGMLDKLLDMGIRTAFIHNCDNLGATLDDRLLGYFTREKIPFMMEVARRTPSDMKGGHLARHRDGHLLLREAAQCPDAEKAAFQDIERYRYFNTNNLWVDLAYLKDLIRREKIIRLPIILNPKTLDPRDGASPAVYQVETAMGAAISLFPGARAVHVHRTRFFPVKKCTDLLALRSDFFRLTPDGRMELNPERRHKDLAVTLDSDFYAKIDEFEARFPQGAPSLRECRSFTVKGDVRFGAGVVARGDVVVTNRGNHQAMVADGTVLEGSVSL